MNPTLKLCVTCGRLASWNSHFHAYICDTGKHMERIPVGGTSADATSNSPMRVSSAIMDGTRALDKCESHL